MENNLNLGAIVRIGKGKKLYRITDLATWQDGKPYAVLEKLEGYGTMSAGLDRLKAAQP